MLSSLKKCSSHLKFTFNNINASKIHSRGNCNQLLNIKVAKLGILSRYYSIDRAVEASINEQILKAEEKALKKDLEEENSEDSMESMPKEIGGPSGPEPTRYGDWEKNGRVSDF